MKIWYNGLLSFSLNELFLDSVPSSNVPRGPEHVLLNLSISPERIGVASNPHFGQLTNVIKMK